MGQFGNNVKSPAVFLSLVLLGATMLVQAQPPTGEIRIEVTDPSGAAMVASGSLRNIATGEQRNFQTDAQGMYTWELYPTPVRRFPKLDLPPNLH